MTNAINTVNTTDTTNAASAAGSSKSVSALGEDAFFKMLTAQLKYQDPLNPQDGTQFAAQLAQFTSLEQLSNLNKTLEAQGASYSALMSLQSVSLIGKKVEASIVDSTTAQSKTITGTVSAVQFKDNSIYLIVNDQTIAFADVVSVE